MVSLGEVLTGKYNTNGVGMNQGRKIPAQAILKASIVVVDWKWPEGQGWQRWQI